MDKQFNVIFGMAAVNENGALGSYLAALLSENKSVEGKGVVSSIMKAVQEYSIDLENIVEFKSDNLQYTYKAFNETLELIFANCVYLSCIKDIMHLITKDLLRSFKLTVLWRIKFYPFWEQEVQVFRCSGKIGLGKKYHQQLTYDGGHILNAKKSFKLHLGRKKFLENEKMLPDY